MKFERYNTIIIPLPESYSDAIELIKSDYYRYGKKSGWRNMIVFALVNHGFRFSCMLRLCAVKGFLFPLFRIAKKRITNKYAINISHKMKLGYGLYFFHPYSVVINPSAIIGSNFSISQFVTIGALEGDAAIIGNDVYIGPNSCIVEKVIIGSNSVIGAGSVVIKDVPPICTVAGNPAKVISKNNSERFIYNKYNYPVP